jgi:hypothetical protein
MKIIDTKKLFTILFVTIILSAAYFGINKVNAEIAPSVAVAGGGTLYCPVNTTYSINQLTLKIDFGYGMGVHCELTYDVDGVYNGPIPLVITNPDELHVVNPTTGTVGLPQLSEGSHCLTITVTASLNGYHGANPPGSPFKPTGVSGNYEAIWVTSVYFTIDTNGQSTDKTPPVITDLTISNQTYRFPRIALLFHVNEDIAKATYSLDGQDNITITENTTLTNLTPGQHNLTLYVQDKAGNMAVSQTSFIIAEQQKLSTQIVEQQPKPFPAALTAAALLLTLCAAFAIVLYFKRCRKPLSDSLSEENKPV